MRKVVVRRLCGFCQDYFEHLFNAYTLITYADYISPYLSLRCYNSGCVSGCIFRKTRPTNCNSASTGITASLQCTSAPSCLSHTRRHDRLTALGPGLPGWTVSEETFAHSHPSWSSDILCQLPSSTIRSIASSLTVQFTCLTVLFHNLSPGPLWSSSWSGPQLLLLLFLFFKEAERVRSLMPTIVFFYSLKWTRLFAMSAELHSDVGEPVKGIWDEALLCISAAAGRQTAASWYQWTVLWSRVLAVISPTSPSSSAPLPP